MTICKNSVYIICLVWKHSQKLLLLLPLSLLQSAACVYIGLMLLLLPPCCCCCCCCPLLQLLYDAEDCSVVVAIVVVVVVVVVGRRRHHCQLPIYHFFTAVHNSFLFGTTPSPCAKILFQLFITTKLYILYKGTQGGSQFGVPPVSWVFFVLF